MIKMKDALEARQNNEYKRVLSELLYQLADDDFILSYRGSEWLGLAPHIEEDVAYSSITQNMMGHAFMYYQLLTELGEGDVDQLAHLRPPEKRRNAILLEEVNGPGTYLHEPKYDWAFAVVRHYFYDLYKDMKLESLKNSSYEPLATLAIKIRMEQYYHLLHWRTWFYQLISAGGEAKTKMMAEIFRVWEDFAGVLSLGPMKSKMVEFALIDSEEQLKAMFLQKIEQIFRELELPKLPEPGMKKGDGRSGFHSDDLTSALATLSEVYRTDPKAIW